LASDWRQDNAVNGSGLELGSGNDSTRMARVTLRWNWDAIGAHFLSETRINNRRDFGGSFNFADHIGFG
jgi:hypothetical protein